MTKPEHYAALCEHLASQWAHDARLSEEAPELWEQAREIDRWLVQYRDDARVSEEQFERNCRRLVGLYLEQG